MSTANCNYSLNQATCALGELMQLEEMEDIVSEHYHLFWASLMMRFGTSNGMSDNIAAE
jgi:hypothetical protein